MRDYLCMVKNKDIQAAQARYRKASKQLSGLPDDCTLERFAKAEREFLSAERSLDALLSQTERWNKQPSLISILERGGERR